MTPNRTHLTYAFAWILFWTLMASVSVQDYYRDHQGKAVWQPLLWEGSSMAVATLLLLVQRHFTARHRHLLASPWRWFGLNALWLPLYWICFTPLVFGMRHAVYALAGLEYSHRAWPELFFYESLKISILVTVFTVIRFGILSYQELTEAKLRAQQANALLRQAQLQRLTQQMQPHFLFNALNTVSSLMHTDVARADATLIRLADVLRATLDVSELHEAPLATELRLVRGYAQVMQERYSDRVDIAWCIDDGALDCMVPLMSIQPLLENIFKHTVERRRDLTRIVVTVAREEGRLQVTLDDDSGALAVGGAPGIGLKNLRERLAVLYGERASVALVALAPAGVRARMELPCAC
ncbi:sensor histidine kinase [Massilia eurypsychrophila]|uniref:Sensor histidine kinase n=1 Tax=Massilia eurypsychrophila TaxID=1485217 RepID=A0A2G8TDZ8_9BURK|nr:histidine kinase [Massilia eurypsychrophila]PIL44272.1 sensor histidine kinase [Massilia eurypsychrophila]